LRVEGLGFKGFRVSGFRVSSSESGVLGFRFRIQGSGYRT
jgi:hypothetical protein